MKIRKGFVSNSSSSSFVVAFPKRFEITPKNLKQYLFPNQETISVYGQAVTVDQAIDIIMKDMIEQIAEDMVAIREKFLEFGGSLDDGPTFEDFRRPEGHPDGRYDWNAYGEACEKHANKTFEKFKSSDEDIFIFEYSDNDGALYSTLEHGGTFDNVKHIRISHH